MFDDIQVPDTIDAYVTRGLSKALKLKRRAVARKWTGIAAAVLLTVFVGAIRVSPVMASYVSKIPGLEYIVNLISTDKGLQAAVDNEFLQHVGVSCEKEGIVLTVKDIIVDKTRMLVFYSIENKGGHTWPRLGEIPLYDEQGKNLELSTSHGSSPSEKAIFEGTLNYNFPDPQEKPDFEIPDTVVLKAKMMVTRQDMDTKDAQKSQNIDQDTSTASVDKILDSTWEVTIPIDKSKFKDMEKIYEVHRTVEVEGQKITFEKMTVYPTRISLDITYDPANTKKIFNFEDLAIVDEKGNQWGTIANGVSASIFNEDTIRLYLQSNYFSNPKQLCITGSSLHALDKDAREVIVDVENKQLRKAPDQRLKLVDAVMKSENDIYVRFELVKDAADTARSYNVFGWEAKDSSGNVWKVKESGSGGHQETLTDEMFYSLHSNTKLDGFLHFMVSNEYPTRIRQPFKVEIPVK